MKINMAILELHQILFMNLIVVTISSGILIEAVRDCSPGINTVGYTEPRGDILVEYGKPLDITCVIHEKYVNSNNTSTALKFVLNNKKLPNEMIEVLNSSSIKLHIDNPPKTKKAYYVCKYNDSEVVCANMVFVGTKPLPIDDFDCIGYNYDNLTCTWTAPENYIDTKYELVYSFLGRSSVFSSGNCPDMVYPVGTARKMSCFWNISTEPQYRQSHDKYLFTLKMHNFFGKNEMNITFKHFQRVLPGPPENLTSISVTPNSIYLYWSIPHSMQNFPPGVDHRVLYQSEYGTKEWYLPEKVGIENRKEVYFNLTGLKYAHALYDIRVSMKANYSLPNNETIWSKNASITVRTGSKIPGAAPKTNIGSFEIILSGNNLQYREAYVYWKQIPEEIKNGVDFTYNISVEGDYRNQIKPVEITNAYAKFKNLTVSNDYKFTIWSQNSDGVSKDKSFVYIPSRAKRIGEPQSFTKIAFGDGKYELAWELPKDHQHIEITNFTIFWCSHDRDRPYQCTGHLNWIEVPSTLTVYNITVSETKINQFAISTNTEHGSSGMLWASCTVIHNKNIGKMKNVWISRTGSTFIEVSWKLDCSDRVGHVKGFMIYYCPIISPKQTDCKAPPQNYTVNNTSTVGGANVTDLIPYTTYMLSVAVITKHTTFSQQSDPLYTTTPEAAPSSAPLDVKITEVTNSSIIVTWNPPNATNGILKYYKVYYNNYSITIDKKGETMCVIKNLRSFENYLISVVACTIGCSEPSKTINVTTKMGYPGRIKQPNFHFQNSTNIVITWERPSDPRGKIDGYDVQIIEKLHDENRSIPLFNVTDPQYSLENCGDDRKYNTFFISVRAVNLINGKRYEGPWSEELESYCIPPPPKYLIWVLVPAIILCVIGLFYLAKRIYLKCQSMRNVEVKLPPGLTPVVTTDWNEPKIHEPDSSPKADEELLLAEKGEGRQLSGDSSGCSSGHESVTSSIESGTHISSTSDSGTEQPRSPSSDEMRKNSLRLRSVASSRPSNKSYVIMPTDSVTPTNWNTKTTPPGSYCVLGVDPTPSVESDLSYSPICQVDPNKVPHITCDTSASPPPYVLTGDLTKHVNPGYVPYNTPQTTDKNPAYVVAGNKNMLMQDLLRRELKPTTTNDKPHYVQVAEKPTTGLKQTDNISSWQQPPIELQLNKIGYVTIGNATPPKINSSDHNKGYVPHRHYDSKPCKED